MKTIILILITSLMFLMSCGYSNYPKTGISTYHNTNPDEILVFPKDMDQEYKIIGAIGTETTGDSDEVIEHLKKKASRQGADAIIHVKLNNAKSSGRTGVSGVAVKLIEESDEQYSLANK